MQKAILNSLSTTEIIYKIPHRKIFITQSLKIKIMKIYERHSVKIYNKK